ncbi:L-xylulose reductase [Manduca sexta]|uniref:Ketoreductase domain-containing protein n=1 Tax=Manduca sexta TaxID=7130 RepID=A0A921ZJ73_MANSE|nr:L-xylulose reductase [Manduca sexta]KAG6457622.1 hypothetical protein O3G_MSEX010407 [Manduca sexta]
MDFSNKVVLVTGGSSGIGAAIAIKFAAHGAQVAIVGRNKVKLQNVSEECSRNGSKPLVIVADVSNDVDVKRIVTETIAHFGTLHVLINNAGIGGSASILSSDTVQMFDRVMATNVRSVVHLTHLAAPHLIETKGNIINISSIASLKTVSKEGFAYSASKACLDHFSRCIALELASKGVRVNTVNPGPVKSDIIANMGVPEVAQKFIWEKMQKVTALDRISEPEEVADLVLFLASDKARSITGSTYVTDNGACLNGIME